METYRDYLIAFDRHIDPCVYLEEMGIASSHSANSILGIYKEAGTKVSAFICVFIFLPGTMPGPARFSDSFTA